MYKAYKFRMYLTDNQRELVHKTFGCSRFVYNHFLNKCKENGYQKAYDMCNELKELVIEYPFLKEVDSCSLRNSIFNLEDSYKIKEVDTQYLKINLVNKVIGLLV